MLDAALPQHPGARVVVGRRPRELAARDGAAQARKVTAVKMAAQVRSPRTPSRPASWRMGRDLGTHRCQGAVRETAAPCSRHGESHLVPSSGKAHEAALLR